VYPVDEPEPAAHEVARQDETNGTRRDGNQELKHLALSSLALLLQYETQVTKDSRVVQNCDFRFGMRIAEISMSLSLAKLFHPEGA
jgi:hypothetical protein